MRMDSGLTSCNNKANFILSINLPETNSLPLKTGRNPKRTIIDNNRIVVVFQPFLFGGYVSFREGIIMEKTEVGGR